MDLNKEIRRTSKYPRCQLCGIKIGEGLTYDTIFNWPYGKFTKDQFTFDHMGKPILERKKYNPKYSCKGCIDKYKDLKKGKTIFWMNEEKQ